MSLIQVGVRVYTQLGKTHRPDQRSSWALHKHLREASVGCHPPASIGHVTIATITRPCWVYGCSCYVGVRLRAECTSPLISRSNLAAFQASHFRVRCFHGRCLCSVWWGSSAWGQRPLSAQPAASNIPRVGSEGLIGWDQTSLVSGRKTGTLVVGRTTNKRSIF